jgi:predicted enzyme related to lactoylglutathione lyase
MDASPIFRRAGISYLHIPATDPQQSARFYEACFGWKIGGTADDPSFEDGTGHVIGHWVTDLKPVGAAGVIPYVYVDRVDDILVKVKANGGTVERDPYPEGDLLVTTFCDPAGNVVGAWQHEDRTT